MSTRRRVCVVVTARPSYSRIRTALRALRDRPDVELQLVLAASSLLERYGTVERHVASDDFHVSARVHMVVEGGSPTVMAKTTGLGMLELATVFDHLRPDVVVTIADRFETMATAVSAAYMNIPVAHVQGGEITGSIDEKVRHAITKLADVHLVASCRAAERVRGMGEVPGSIFVTGCPSIDLAAEVLADPALDFDPVARYGGVGATVDMEDDYVVVLQHPVTTEHEQARRHVTETLHAVHESGVQALWFWPNVDAGGDGTSNGIRAFRERTGAPRMRFFKSMAPTDFLRVLYHARCVVGNSSVGIRECSFLGVPTVNVGTRQDGRDRGANVLDVGYDRGEIGEAMRRHLSGGRFPSDGLYGDGNAGERIATVLAEAEMHVEKRLCC
jgi:UDP-hydrolysing UDP-N-acetyl-D-glucosamine 2-epimerase